MSSKTKSLRRSKWLGGLQLKFVLVTFTVATLALSASLLFTLSGLSALSEEPVATANDAFQKTRSLLFHEYYLSVPLALFLSLWAAVLFVFKVCGPLYRIKFFLRGMIDGRWDRPLDLRAGDELQDVRELVNSTMDTLTARVQSQHEVIQEVQQLLSEASVNHPQPAKLDELNAKVEHEISEFARRFPDEERTAPTQEPVAEQAVGSTA